MNKENGEDQDNALLPQADYFGSNETPLTDLSNYRNSYYDAETVATHLGATSSRSFEQTYSEYPTRNDDLLSFLFLPRLIMSSSSHSLATTVSHPFSTETMMGSSSQKSIDTATPSLVYNRSAPSSQPFHCPPSMPPAKEPNVYSECRGASRAKERGLMHEIKLIANPYIKGLEFPEEGGREKDDLDMMSKGEQSIVIESTCGADHDLLILSVERSQSDGGRKAILEKKGADAGSLARTWYSPKLTHDGR